MNLRGYAHRTRVRMLVGNLLERQVSIAQIAYYFQRDAATVAGWSAGLSGASAQVREDLQRLVDTDWRDGP